MSIEISNGNKCNFLHIVELLKECRAKFCTIKELSSLIDVSERKLVDFENGKNFDFWLLQLYSHVLDIQIDFNINIDNSQNITLLNILK